MVVFLFCNLPCFQFGCNLSPAIQHLKHVLIFRDLGLIQTQAQFSIYFTNLQTIAIFQCKETSAMDSENREAISYNEIIVIYSNDSGDNLILNAHPDLEDIPNTLSPVVSSKTIGNVTVNYYLDHYRYVPDDYELSEEDRIWEQQPGNYIAYGSEVLEETSIAFLSWSVDEIYYSIMDSDTAESPEFLFSMAEVLINNTK
jgi:hypothetical protein